MNSAASQSGSSWFWFIVVMSMMIAVFAFVILIVVLSMRSVAKNRQLLHTERMRAIEMGYPLEPPERAQADAKFMHNIFWISFWMGFGVPAAVFGSAATASERLGGRTELGVIVWLGASVASVASVICATVLMIYSRKRQTEMPELPSKPMPFNR